MTHVGDAPVLPALELMLQQSSATSEDAADREEQPARGAGCERHEDRVLWIDHRILEPEMVTIRDCWGEVLVATASRVQARHRAILCDCC